jgi:hypothetical protein
MARNVPIQMPDGSTKTINNVPDDFTNEQLREKIGASSKISTESGLDQLIIGTGAGMTRAGQGIKQVGLTVGEEFGMFDEGATQAYTQEVNRERDLYDNTPVAQSALGQVGAVVGEALPLAAVPGGAVGGLVKRAATGAAGGAFSGLLEFTAEEGFDNGERLRNMAAGGIFGGSFPFITGGISKIKNVAGDLLNEFTEKGAKKQIRDLVTRADLDTPLAKISDELGVWLTPSEITGRADLTAFERGLSVASNTPAAKVLADRLSKRTAIITANLDDIIAETSQNNPQAAKLMQSGYDALKSTKLSPKYIREEILNDPFIRSQWKTMHKSQAWQGELDGLDKLSAGKMDVFKRFLQEKEEKFFKAGTKQASKTLGNFRKKMVNDMDAFVPEYALSRSMAQLKIISNKLTGSSKKSLRKVRNLDGEYSTDVIDIFRREFKSDADFESMLRGLDKLPNAQRKLSQVRDVLQALEQSPVSKVFKASVASNVESSGTAGKGLTGAITLGIAKFFRSGNSERIMSYITDPKYVDDLLEGINPSVLSKVTPAAGEAINKILSRITALEASPDENKQQ